MAEELGVPETPSPGMAQLYPGSDGRLYLMTGDGVATPIQVTRSVVLISDADSPYAIDETSGIVFINASAGGVVINLPAGADSRPEGYTFKAVNATNTITLTPSGSETIDGASTLTMSTHDAVRLVWSGTEWGVL